MSKPDKSGIFKKWWLLQHINDPNGTWFPEKLITIFGQPIAFMWFRAWGPFNTYESAARTANKANGFDENGEKE